MNCEIFFEINGGEEERNRVACKIAVFLAQMEHSGDIAQLDGSFDEKDLLLFLGGSK